MEAHTRKPRLFRAVQTCGLLAALVLAALSAAGCDADKQAVPDPDKAPIPRTVQGR